MSETASAKIQRTLEQIQSVDEGALQKARAHWDTLAKPPGSLGRLEELASRYIAIRGDDYVLPLSKSVVIFAGDHGVTEEGVSAYPAAVTAMMVQTFLGGKGAINVLARHAGAETCVVDMGVNANLEALTGLVHRKIAPGTQNFLKQPAMTGDQAEAALATGIALAEEQAESGAHLLATGDMGIGNTTASAALLAVFGGDDVASLTGRGTGVDDRALANKIAVIERAIAARKPNAQDPIDVLAKLGGFEIGGIAGFMLGAGARQIPVVVDGLISGAAAVLAVELAPALKDYLFVSHRSVEPGHEICFKKLNQAPLFDLKMRLGEGTGATLAMNLLEASLKLHKEMATLKEIGVTGEI